MKKCTKINSLFCLFCHIDFGKFLLYIIDTSKTQKHKNNNGKRKEKEKMFIKENWKNYVGILFCSTAILTLAVNFENVCIFIMKLFKI